MGHFKDEMIRLLSKSDKPNFVKQVNRGGSWCTVAVWKDIATTYRPSNLDDRWFQKGIKAVRKQKDNRRRKYGFKYLKNENDEL